MNIFLQKLSGGILMKTLTRSITTFYKYDTHLCFAFAFSLFGVFTSVYHVAARWGSQPHQVVLFPFHRWRNRGLEKTGIRVLKVAETDALPLRWLPPLLHQAPPPLVVSCMNTIHTDCLNGSNWQRKELRGKNLPRSWFLKKICFTRSHWAPHPLTPSWASAPKCKAPYF